MVCLVFKIFLYTTNYLVNETDKLKKNKGKWDLIDFMPNDKTIIKNDSNSKLNKSYTKEKIIDLNNKKDTTKNNVEKTTEINAENINFPVPTSKEYFSNNNLNFQIDNEQQNGKNFIIFSHF